MSKMKISKLSNENIQDMFTNVFEENVAKFGNIPSFECNCSRETESNDVTMEVTIYGLAGSPSMDEYRNGDVENSQEVVIERDDEILSFNLVPEETHTLNINDYIVVYKSV